MFIYLPFICLFCAFVCNTHKSSILPLLSLLCVYPSVTAACLPACRGSVCFSPLPFRMFASGWLAGGAAISLPGTVSVSASLITLPVSKLSAQVMYSLAALAGIVEAKILMMVRGGRQLISATCATKRSLTNIRRVNWRLLYTVVPSTRLYTVGEMIAPDSFKCRAEWSTIESTIIEWVLIIRTTHIHLLFSFTLSQMQEYTISTQPCVSGGEMMSGWP